MTDVTWKPKYSYMWAPGAAHWENTIVPMASLLKLIGLPRWEECEGKEFFDAMSHVKAFCCTYYALTGMGYIHSYYVHRINGAETVLKVHWWHDRFRKGEES